MAVSIFQNLRATEIYENISYDVAYLAGYNSNVIKWTILDPDAVVTKGSATVTINGTFSVYFENLYPQFIPEIGFYMCELDIKEIVKVFFNKTEDKTYYSTGDTIVTDDTLRLLIDATVSLDYTLYDEPYTESNNTTCMVLRSVKQHLDRNTGHFFNFPDGTPEKFANFLINGKKEKGYFKDRIKIFNGYPMDLSFIVPGEVSAAEYTLYDKTETFVDSYSEGYTATDTIGRLVMSGGDGLHPLLTAYPSTTEGFFQLLLSAHGGGNVSLLTTQYEIINQCGMYMKWWNRNGGWSYWLFNEKNRQTQTTKSLGTIIQNSGVLSYDGDEVSIGYTSEDKIQLTSQDLEQWELDHIIDLATSPSVYLYLGKKGDPVGEEIPTNWLKIPSITNFKYTRKSEQVKYTIGFELDLPRTFTQTL